MVRLCSGATAPSLQVHRSGSQCESEVPIPKSAGDQARGENTRRYFLSRACAAFDALPEKRLSVACGSWSTSVERQGIERSCTIARVHSRLSGHGDGFLGLCDRFLGSDATEQRVFTPYRNVDRGKAGIAVGAGQFGGPTCTPRLHRHSRHAASDCHAPSGYTCPSRSDGRGVETPRLVSASSACRLKRQPRPEVAALVRVAMPQPSRRGGIRAPARAPACRPRVTPASRVPRPSPP